MEELHKLKSMLERELEEFARRDSIESYDLDTIHKLTDTIKNIDKIKMIEEGGYSEDGYSQARGGGGGNRGGGGGGRGGGGYSREGGGYSQEGGGSSYAGGSSYGDDEDYSEARRRRDNRGRYSRDDGRDHMVNQLESMMGRVSSEQDREMLRRMIDQMKGA